MSEGGITRICEGNSTYTSSGSIEYHATDGNLTTSATTTNNTYSGEGINHNGYEPLHSSDTLDTSVDITLNLYFDGTNNNMFNTEAREKKLPSYNEHAFSWLGNRKEDNSYDNGYTNIVNAFEATNKDIPNQAVVYVDGIGTRKKGEDEGLQGKGLAIGKTGYKVKVGQGCQLAAQEVQKKFGLTAADKLKILTVTVYGFSRGAATARYFLHIASTPITIAGTFDGYINVISPNGDITYEKKLDSLCESYGYFGYQLSKNGITSDKLKKIVFNFVGLYDTVSSYGTNHNNDVTELSLKSITKANMVFQIAAEDEFRENFDLTNIDSAGLKGLEITLPGVHSDIGGSYRNDDGPEVRTHYEASYTKRIGENNTFYHNKAKKIKEMLVYEGWYNNDQLVISEEITGENSYKLKLTGTRQLLNTYDKISLARMIAITKQFDVKFIDSRVEKLTKINDPFIKKIESQLMVYIKQCSDLRNDYINNAHNSDESLAVYTQKYLENIKRLNHINDVDLNDLKELRGKYLHWSVNNDKIGLEARTNIIGYAGDLKEQKLRKREIQNG